MDACLPWHEPHKTLLQTAHAQRRMAHAYLLSGPEGLGKHQFAHDIASWLLCTQPQADRRCGHCQGCQLMQAGNHPDYVCISAEGAAGVIKIDQIRHGIEFASKTAQQGGFRIIVINPADRMNTYAANALLKLLEEPGVDTLLMLVSAYPNGLLPTLRSRCHTLTFHNPDECQSLSWLADQGIGQDDTERRTLLVMATGRPYLAKHYADTDQLTQRSQLIEHLSLITKGKKSPVAIAGLYSSDRILSVMECLHQWISEILSYQVTQDENNLKQTDIKPMLKYIASKTSTKTLFVYYDWLLEQRRILKERVGVNGALLLDEIFTRWLHLTV